MKFLLVSLQYFFPGISTEASLCMYAKVAERISQIILPRITPWVYPGTKLYIFLGILSRIGFRIAPEIKLGFSRDSTGDSVRDFSGALSKEF